MYYSFVRGEFRIIIEMISWYLWFKQSLSVRPRNGSFSFCLRNFQLLSLLKFLIARGIWRIYQNLANLCSYQVDFSLFIRCKKITHFIQVSSRASTKVAKSHKLQPLLGASKLYLTSVYKMHIHQGIYTAFREITAKMLFALTFDQRINFLRFRN